MISTKSSQIETLPLFYDTKYQNWHKRVDCQGTKKVDTYDTTAITTDSYDTINATHLDLTYLFLLPQWQP